MLIIWGLFHAQRIFLFTNKNPVHFSKTGQNELIHASWSMDVYTLVAWHFFDITSTPATSLKEAPKENFFSVSQIIFFLPVLTPEERVVFYYLKPSSSDSFSYSSIPPFRIELCGTK